MNKIDRLSLTKDQVINKLSNALTFQQASIALFGQYVTMNNYERKCFSRKYGIDISSVIRQNVQKDKCEKVQMKLNQIFICDCCGKEYRNGDHLSNNKSGRHFCSNLCSKRYATSFNNNKRKKKISESIKLYCSQHTKVLACDICGKLFQAGIKSIHGKCQDCIDKAVAKYNLSIKQVKQRTICSVCGSITGTCRRPEICRNKTVFAVLHNIFEFDLTALGTERVYEEFDRISQILNDMYWNKNMSISDIFNIFKCDIKSSYIKSTGNFIKLLRRFIKLRGVAEGQRLYIDTHEYSIDDNFTLANHIAWNGKVFSCKSTYEIDLCKELDIGQIDYQVEPFTIDYYDSIMKRSRFAIPDFYLPDYNMLIEVKSSFTYDRQNMIDKAKAYIQQGYDFILEYEHKSYSFSQMVSEIFNIEKNLTFYRNKCDKL